MKNVEVPKRQRRASYQPSATAPGKPPRNLTKG